MARLVAVALLFACPATLLAQAPAWSEQFIGKTLQGWEIDGDTKIEDGVLIVGGKIETKLRCVVPLGNRFELRLECMYSGFQRPQLHFETSAPFWQRELTGAPRAWGEFIVKRTRTDLGFGHQMVQSFRHLEVTGHHTSTVPPGSGDIRELAFIIPAGQTMSIRRIALQTTPAGADPGGLWAPLLVLVLVLLGIMTLGWFLNRNKPNTHVG